MRAVLQRVSRASVSVEGEIVGRIDRPGLLALVAAARDDTATDAETMARKIADLRLLPGETSVADEAGAVLVISQFTLYGDTAKGRRPSWSRAAPASLAEPLVDAVVRAIRDRGIEVATGSFGAVMSVELVNEGPFTVIVDT